jgi:hypothetical protein
MLKSFDKYNESIKNVSSDALKYSSDIINILKKNESPGDDYIEIRELEYIEPEAFDLIVQLKVESNPDFEKDSHFKTLPWEEINFKEYGFAIDANTHLDKTDKIIPHVIVTLIIDPNRIPELYKELSFKLTDIIMHERKHTNQVGWNREPFNVRPSSHYDRTSSKKSYKYFILPDEIEAYVYGMYTRSKIENTPIDDVFYKYLNPFIKTGEISKSELKTVLNAWIKHTLENYPDANISRKRPEINKIVNSI